MGAVIPIVMMVASAAAATAAVYTAITVATVLTIVLAAVSVAATAAAVVSAIQGDMRNAMLFAGIGIAGGIGTIYVAAHGAIAQASSLMAQGMAEATAASVYLESSFAVQAMGWVTSIQAGFGSFLEAIHFKVALAAHQIAYLVSSDYRNMMSQVFAQVQTVSQSLGLATNDLNLMLRDARSVILDTSAMMGHGYDIGELTYWASVQDFFKTTSSQMNVYKNNPGQLLFDLDRKIFKPAVDTKAETQGMVYNTLDSVVRLTETTVTDLARVNDDLKRLAHDLPESIRKEFAPAIIGVTARIDDFVVNTYTPVMDGVHTYIHNLQVEHGFQELRISDLIERLRKPSTILMTMDELSTEEALAEEEFLAAKTGRSLVRQLESFESAASGERAETQAILDAIPAVEEIIPEAFMGGLTPEIGPPPPVIPRDKWDVGEY